MGTKPKGGKKACQGKVSHGPDRLAQRRGTPSAGLVDEPDGQLHSERGDVMALPFDDPPLEVAPGFLEAEPVGVAPIEGPRDLSELAEFDKVAEPSEPPEPPHCP